MLLLHLGALAEVNVNVSLEAQGAKIHLRVLADIEPKVNTLIDGKARYEAVLVVNVRANGAYTIRGKYVILVFIHKLN